MKRMLMLALAGLAMASGAWAKDVAYLGVATEPLDPMTGRHLGLGEGVGLAVAHIDEAGVLNGKVPEEFRGRLGDMQDSVKVEIRTRSEPRPAPRSGGRGNVL